MGNNVVAHDVMHGKSIARITDGRGGDVTERHRAIFAQGSDPGIGGRWHNRAQQPNRHRTVEFLDEAVDVGALRPPAQAADSHHFVLFRHVYHDRRDSGELHHVAVYDPQRHPRRNPSVDGVAACFQNIEPSLGR